MLHTIDQILIHALSAEAPTVETDAKYEKYRNGYDNLLNVDRQVVNEDDDYLVNADVDLAIISTIQLFEGRMRFNVKDGDCRNTYKKINGKSVVTSNCRSIGNMQISRGAVTWAKNLNKEKFESLTIDQLRTPEMNTRVGLTILKSFKHSCKSNLPGVWITAFGQGHCPTKNQLDFEGTRRCAVLTAELNAAGTTPVNWKCGHEGKKMKDPTALKFIQKIEELNKDGSFVEASKN